MVSTLFKRTSRIAAVSALLAGSVFGATATAQTDMGRVTLATGPAGTFYNQAGVALSNMLQQQLGITSTARPFGGTTVYLPQLHRGEVELGINSALDSAAAFHGTDPYPQAMSKLRTAMLVFRAPYALHVAKASGIKSIADLKGKPIVTAFRSVASFGLVHKTLLATAGMTFDDVEKVEVSGVPDGLRSLASGRVAATGTIPNIGLVREADATMSGGILVLPIGPNEKALEELPGFTATTMQPSSRTVGFDGPTRIAQFDVYLNTSTNESADHVYAIVKALHGNWEKLQKDVPGLRGTNADGLVPLNMSHPYHEGAIRYFKEVGLWTAEHDRRQQALLK